MILQSTRNSRRGVKAVELALIAPLLFLLIIGLMVGGLGVFRYHQVASLAREAARYASVRGKNYADETGKPAATEKSIHENVVAANAISMDQSRLKSSVSWDKSNSPKHVAADRTVTRNSVSVAVTYDWFPEMFLGGITLSSTSTVPMTH